ncbi:unnamed protein product [[Candida] boidinii]|uniref:Unnamed protein product n=1 Tax=Candida boidinii TaxID=5477 RepID=A0A9W6T0A7_CANBO|nr:hypothetical protein B5S30_g582 [[Candida] boidinii]OWB83028.1 hypothetical protein B5S33_g1657 [[Candida] boidinii]GME72076.1 unnamed protein product [[Candida] boidinii]
MSALDQSLDSIIASDPKLRRQAKPNKVRRGSSNGNKVGKAVGKKQVINKKKVVPRQKPAPRAAPVSTTVDSAIYAKKVVVQNLPKDIKQDAIKEFFQSEIGPVKTAVLSYNSRGQSMGIATVIFAKPALAKKAVDKYNDSPIDSSNTKLKLELVIDPSLKPLAARITPNVVRPVSNVKANVKARLDKSKKPAARPAKKVQQKKTQPRKKKTVEELDQEMEDYFSKNQ